MYQNFSPFLVSDDLIISYFPLTKVLVSWWLVHNGYTCGIHTHTRAMWCWLYTASSAHWAVIPYKPAEPFKWKSSFIHSGQMHNQYLTPWSIMFMTHLHLHKAATNCVPLFFCFFLNEWCPVILHTVCGPTVLTLAQYS